MPLWQSDFGEWKFVLVLLLSCYGKIFLTCDREFGVSPILSLTNQPLPLSPQNLYRICPCISICCPHQFPIPTFGVGGILPFLREKLQKEMQVGQGESVSTKEGTHYTLESGPIGNVTLKLN